jgi:hypothetical protein
MANANYNYRTPRGAAAGQPARAYAMPDDFCAIFSDDVDSLYSLALVLTRSHETAQQCFLAALDDCRTASTVFPEWARSWSRRAVIKSAIRLLDPVSKAVDGEAEPELEAIASQIDASARPYLQVRSLDRFVFVISMLEGYTVRECAALLGCGPRQVEEGRIRVLEQIGAAGRDLARAPYDTGFHNEQDSVFPLH